MMTFFGRATVPKKGYLTLFIRPFSGSCRVIRATAVASFYPHANRLKVISVLIIRVSSNPFL
jgi:hypothetical protein